MAKALAPGATLVSYAGAFRKPITVALGALVSQGLTLKGFSPARALAGMPKAERDAAVNAAVADVRGDKGGELELPAVSRGPSTVTTTPVASSPRATPFHRHPPPRHTLATP